MRVLHLDASSRFDRSHTRRLSALFVNELRSTDEETEIVRRDLAVNPPPFVDEAWIAAAFAKPERRTPEMRAALRISDELVDELVACDVYVMGVPMYNFSVPGAYKAYVDQIVRVGRTFSFDPSDIHRPYRGLLQEKQLFLLTARGDAGYEHGGRYEMLNHLDPYVRTVFGFIGVTEVTSIAAEHDEFGGVALRDSVATAEHRVKEAARQVAASLRLRVAVCGAALK
jgi:FMN-dependent NADH-azoreductase